MKQTSSKLLPKIIYGQVHVGVTIDNYIVSIVLYTLSEEINPKYTIGDHKNSLGKSIQSTTYNRH